ncbi:mitochondrial ribosomal protein L23 [Blumeria hordei DH14]|uniref:Large ribosomal subunit protein uL23m n=1 Tax=Blumeria graminis f. sp. hordei (strain DH14) TaxID=546991 RepID=N1J958_BLUG1|nr:mitochondrial ribosomal protein L23 [Blumeria hordei DH14]
MKINGFPFICAGAKAAKTWKQKNLLVCISMANLQNYRPDFTITLLNTPNSPPTFASFVVPLKFNKLDMRDYLWNMYNIRCLDVRSFIIQQKLQFDRPGALRPRREPFRPRSIKRMTIEMEKGFVWPKMGDLSQWDHETFLASEKEQEEFQNDRQPSARQNPSKERESLAQQARELIKQSQRQKEEMLISKDNLEEVEVEADIDLKKDLGNR